MRNLLLWALVACALSGCHNTLQVTYLCDPAGAGLYEDNTKKMGTCPATIDYAVTDQNKKAGYIILKGMTAFWVSGVSSSVSSIRADLSNGYTQHFNFTRPRDVAGYDVDARYALDLERNRIAEQQEEDMAYSNFLRALANSQKAQPQQRQLNCTSRNIAGTVYTNCN